MIKIYPRYSTTDEWDEKGRWARLFHYNDQLLIAWVNKEKLPEGWTGPELCVFYVSTFFPLNNNDSPTGHAHFFTFEEATQYIYTEWEKFLQIISS